MGKSIKLQFDTTKPTLKQILECDEINVLEYCPFLRSILFNMWLSVVSFIFMREKKDV